MKRDNRDICDEIQLDGNTRAASPLKWERVYVYRLPSPTEGGNHWANFKLRCAEFFV